MRFRGTLVLLAILIALAAYVLLVERNAPSAAVDGATPAPTTLPPLLRFAPADARLVRIESLFDGRYTEFVYRDDGLWHISAPVEGEADQGKVVLLLEDLADLTPRRALTETVASLSDYGLDPPAMRVVVELEDGSSPAVLLGTRNVGGSGFYAQAEGEPTVYVISLALGTNVERYLDEPPVRPTPTPTVEQIPTPDSEATPTPQG
ncbi:MAG TPA: DUF4340 domain-containing protein [Chloroflexi bacterium]|jgi:hypothetical protein|nr:DUF4340 domain-containing protein [Chloroflexota bacterium]